MKLLVNLERDETGMIVAQCPAVPGCISQGKTEQEALSNIREAIEAQQAFSGLGVETEELDVNRVLKDSIVIQNELIRSHSVAIERDFRAMPLITVNRTKLLHVFLN